MFGPIDECRLAKFARLPPFMNDRFATTHLRRKPLRQILAEIGTFVLVAWHSVFLPVIPMMLAAPPTRGFAKSASSDAEDEITTRGEETASSSSTFMIPTAT